MTAATHTHCPYCSLQCGITLIPRPDGSLELTGREDFPVNRGGLCIKGATATNQLKPATTETGLVVQVPPFIGEGDVIRVNTETGEYQSRA